MAQFVADPDYLDQLSDEVLVDVLADLEALRVRVWVQLLRRSDENEEGEQASAEPEQDQMLTIEEAAEILGVDRRWLYDRSDELPFTRKLAPRDAAFLRAMATSVAGGTAIGHPAPREATGAQFRA